MSKEEFVVQRDFDGKFWTGTGWIVSRERANSYASEGVATITAQVVADAFLEQIQVVGKDDRLVVKVLPTP